MTTKNDPEVKGGVFTRPFNLPQPLLWVMWSLFLAVLILLIFIVSSDPGAEDAGYTILFMAFLVVFTYPGKNFQTKVLALGKKLEELVTVVITWIIYAAIGLGALWLLFSGVSWLFSGSSGPSIEDQVEDAAQDAVDDFKSNCYEKGSVLICPND